MLQRLPIALAQVKAEEITKKVHNNIIKLIQIKNGYFIFEL